MDRKKEDSLIEDLKEIQSILVSEGRLLEAEALSELAEKTGLLIDLRASKDDAVVMKFPPEPKPEAD